MGRLCLVSGGTGGHLMPALVLARSMQERGREPLLVIEGRDVERELVRRELPDVAAVELSRSSASPFMICSEERSPRPHIAVAASITDGRSSIAVS